MPKSAKKRREKAADFAKAKLKLGKGKAAAPNVIDTSFKARSIALPNQSITAERADDDDAPKTRRHLSIDELFVQLKHYNATVRREAIAGLKELFKTHPELLESHITQTLRSCAPITTDEDATVRKALLSLLTWLFDTVPADKIRPHASALLLFVTSAQTHIFPEIRVDGVRFLNVLLSSVPEVVTRAWADESTVGSSSAADGRRVLSGYLALLNASSSSSDAKDAPSTSGAVLSPASRLLVLRSLSTFLRNAVQTSESSSATLPLWFLASSFSTQQAFDSFARVLRQEQTAPITTWKAERDEGDGLDFVAGSAVDPWTFSHIVESVTAATATSSSAVAGQSAAITIRTADLAHTLQPMLTAAFLDGAPSLHAVQSRMNASAQMDIDTVVTVAEIVRTLYVAIFSSGALPPAKSDVACNDLRSVLSYMDPYFPFHVAGSHDHQLGTEVQRLNLIYCELTGLLALAQGSMATGSAPRSRGSAKRKLQQGQALAVSAQMERIATFVVDLLDTRKVSQSLQTDAYRSLLPSVWALLNADSSSSATADTVQQRVLAAAVQHASQSQSSGAVKPLATLFVAHLVLLQYEPQYRGAFRVPPALTKELERWLQELPKLCWELGDNSLPFTEAILTFLLRFVQRTNPTPVVMTSLKSRFCPYFMISHATRGKLHGPFAKLQSASSTRGAGSLRRLALDLASTLTRHDETQDLNTAVRWAVAATDDSVLVR